MYLLSHPYLRSKCILHTSRAETRMACDAPFVTLFFISKLFLSTVPLHSGEISVFAPLVLLFRGER
jgi:hypothetical protein